jgi:hypothetical protein
MSPLDAVPMPAQIAKLPRHGGYPVPFFVHWQDGVPVFPVCDQAKWMKCVGQSLCWICGGLLGRDFAFPLGAMGTINRVSAEPPSHRECVVYGLRVCPFLVNPQRGRVPVKQCEQFEAPAGIVDDDNPGVMAIWMTRGYSLIDTATTPLISVGNPFAVDWYSRGRPASPLEVAEAFRTDARKLMTDAVTEFGAAGAAEVTGLVNAARRHLPDPPQQRWLMYVRWKHTGKRETIVTTFPEMVHANPLYYVWACMPMPAIAVRPLARFPSIGATGCCPDATPRHFPDLSGQ